uniref:WW domain-containing protein n=1 Tax=Entomoneis paludosa TaxID=265537 RepID=A0A7S2Y6M6_9STRA
MCVSNPEDREDDLFFDDSEVDKPKNKASAMLARALVSEVTDNPKTMKQAEMAAREYQLLKAQQAASRRANAASNTNDGSQPVGAPGGVGPPNVLTSLAFAVTGDETAGNVCVNPKDAGMMTPGGLAYDEDETEYTSPYAVTIGLSLSRRHSSVGHPDTVTRQTAFDFNELQDRNYKYVSSTDASGWRAGGGEKGGAGQGAGADASAAFEEGISTLHQDGQPQTPTSQKASSANSDKIPAPDAVHIPIIHINCESDDQVDQVIHALASGEIFIPHMAILPEALSVNGISPPDLVVRFGCERNEEVSPEEWPNWCLEFMHNQLYEYFYSIGARWMKRPFSITLARKVKWKTVKHMNRYFAHAEQVIEQWRDKGPQILNPQLSYVEGGATPEEVAHPHGIYLMRKGVPTNYFAPNFDPPYTTKMTRSLLENVLNKSWDKKRQEWTSEPIPKLVTPNLLLAMACGCADPSADGFMAREVTAATIRKSVQAATTSGNRSQMLEAAANANTQYYEDQRRNNMSSEVSTTSSNPSQSHHSTNSQSHRSEKSARRQAQARPYSSPSHSYSEDHEEDPHYDTTEDPHVETVDSDESGDDFDGETGARRGKAAEEKKTDDVSEKSVNSRNNKKAAWRSTSSTTEMSEAPSGTTGMTATTVMHANVNKNQRRAFGGEDDWAQPVKGEERPGNEKPQSSTRWSKKKKDKQSAREMLDQERKRQEQLLMKVQNDGSKASSKSSQYTMTPVTSSPAKRNTQDIDTSESGASMEYSQDGSSAFMTDGGSTLMGQHFAGDETVSTNSKAVKQKNTEEDDNSALMSVQASSSTVSIVPTDEELFSVGWAKALDASSGNYYYYTLDRKTIIWENPLSSNQSSDGSNKGSNSGVDP